VKEGVYAGLTGPCFETPAEYRYLWRIGADAVGMSTVPEVIVAKHSGMRVFGISIITDLGVEGQTQKVTHEEVQQVANSQEPKMTLIIKSLVGAM
jgi:purine-nucleoside phosphorylase